jgi:hypothetical protein
MELEMHSPLNLSHQDSLSNDKVEGCYADFIHGYNPLNGVQELIANLGKCLFGVWLELDWLFSNISISKLQHFSLL